MVFILSVILSVIIVGSLLILNDLPFVSGTILASGAGERWSVRILSPVILIAGVMLPLFIGNNPIQAAAGVFSPSEAGVVLSIGLATLLAVVATGRFSGFPAIAYAFMAALAGASLASENKLDLSTCGSYILSWITAPLICAVLAALVYRLYVLSTRDRIIHLAILDARLLAVSTLLSFLLLAAVAYNSSILISFLSFESGLPVLAKVVIVIGSVLIIYPFLFKRSCQKKWDIADTELDIDSQSVLTVMIAIVLTLVLFSGNLPGKIGLKATPLPPGTLFVAALTGISVSSGRALLEGKDISSSLAAIIVSPSIAFMSAYCLSKVAAGSWTGTIFIITMFLIAIILTAMLRSKGDKDIQKGILLSREMQAFSTQKTLSALEVKAEMTEKDLLDKLDGKRKELVDFALGIGDQKKFMERIYDELKTVRAMPDGPEKDSMTDDLLSSLRERMYFTSEINDFYARSEVLHRDFNRRLVEAFPNLTENERKLANLLRQGFSSKYIASLMNIAPKSVEINRYRLRAKLGLNRSDNLIKFIKSI
ncbi:MAG: hypothetical protein IKW99_05365 [Bacteroidales bacterium]|nr:hypothetical protein [Bacteroidales bacterium]